MAKRKAKVVKEIKEIKADPLKVSQDFQGMLNNRKFDLKKDDVIKASEAEIEWLKSKGVLK